VAADGAFDLDRLAAEVRAERAALVVRWQAVEEALDDQQRSWQVLRASLAATTSTREGGPLQGDALLRGAREIGAFVAVAALAGIGAAFAVEQIVRAERAVTSYVLTFGFGILVTLLVTLLLHEGRTTHSHSHEE
jgi:hypothetical protein